MALAEEAIGLAKSLDWSIVKGPFWKKENDIYDPEKWDENNEDYIVDFSSVNKSIYKSSGQNNSKKSNPKKGYKNGDYVKMGDVLKGVYYQGGVLAGGSDSEDENQLYDEWKNILLRESLALSSLIKVKNIKASTFFTKGRLNELGQFLQKNKVDIIFVNSTLSFVQKRNLEISFNNYINEKNDRIRAYNIKSALKLEGEATDTESNFSGIELEENKSGFEKKVRILDRFNIILSIFSQRAKSKASQLQIELAYLKYLKTRLARGGHVSYGSLYKEFGGDFLNTFHETQYEVVSGKQSTIKGSVGGSGETQLEIEKRKIAYRESQIKGILEDLKQKRSLERETRREKASMIPTVALLGYTNAGKTALMNRISGADLESENKLFQTLNTTIKKVHLPSKQSALLLDTVGFITDLPHELVESFKSTLEEVFYADLLVHVVDVSNPNYEHQRKTVYSILDEIFPKNKNYKEKLIEVWNKIDLIDESTINKISAYIGNESESSEGLDYPIVPISVKKSINIDMFYNELVNKMNTYLGKEVRELRCDPVEYDKLFKWLKETIGYPSEINYDETTNEMLIKIAMDKSQFETYLENFVIKRENKKRKNRDDFS